MKEQMREAFKAKYDELGVDTWNFISYEKIFEYGYQAALSAVPAQDVKVALFLLKADCLAEIQQFKYGHDAAKAVDQIDLRKYLELSAVPANHSEDDLNMVQDRIAEVGETMQSQAQEQLRKAAS